MLALKTFISEEIPSKGSYPQIEEHIKYVDFLSHTSPCSRLKVAYILVDKDMKRIVESTNGYLEDGSLCRWSADGHMDIHAEAALCRKIADMHIDTRSATAIGTHSPCSDCVNKLAKIGIKKIVFQKMSKDVLALGKARRLGIGLLYYTSKTVVIPDQVIKELERLVGSHIAKLMNNKKEKFMFKDDSIQSAKLEYIINHEKELRNLLDDLLSELLWDFELNIKGDLFNTQVVKLLTQIETETVCLQNAKQGIFLTQHP